MQKKFENSKNADTFNGDFNTLILEVETSLHPCIMVEFVACHVDTNSSSEDDKDRCGYADISFWSVPKHQKHNYRPPHPTHFLTSPPLLWQSVLWLSCILHLQYGVDTCCHWAIYINPWQIHVVRRKQCMFYSAMQQGRLLEDRG